MKRRKDEGKTVGPMFPRLNVNDSDTGGPRAPPRNKMALYEQLSTPSLRSYGHSHNSNYTNPLPPSSQEDANERGMFLSHDGHQSEKQYDQYSDLGVEERKKFDEDDFIVPVFVHSIPSQEGGEYDNDPDRGKRSPSNPNPSYLDHSFQKEESSREFVAELEDKNILRDISNDTECREDIMRNLQSSADITPDDVVSIIGHKRFWEARKAIANQQRLFAIQVFELHKVIKVQRLIAASPHLLLNDSSYLRKPIKVLPRKKIPSHYPIKAQIPKPSHRNEISAENTPPKPSIQNGNSSAPPWSLNPPHGHHWLVPVISPSEGLVYKPYPGPGFIGPALGSYPVYGFPAPNPQLQFPSYPPANPHGCFPPYGMPITTTAAVSDVTIQPIPRVRISQDIEVQGSTGSSPTERQQDSQTSRETEGRSVLPLFPSSSCIDDSNTSPQPEQQIEVIRVVPYKATSATESAARIFRSIQEERRRCK